MLFPVSAAIRIRIDTEISHLSVDIRKSGADARLLLESYGVFSLT